MPKIIVAFDDSEQAADALRLARRLARAYEDPCLIIASAYSYELYDPLNTGTYVWQREHFFRRSALQAAGIAGAEAEELDLRELDASPARGLHDLAESEGAELLVVGSSHRGKVGQLLLGSTAVKLLRSAPCAVAVAPRGYGAETV